MKSFITYSILFISIILLSGCKKYDEDGKRSWHKPEKRVVGTWYLKEFLVDGVDSVYTWYKKEKSDVTDTIKWQLFDARFNFKDDKDESTLDIYLSNVSRYSSLGCNSCYIHTTSDWGFENKKTRLKFKTIDSFFNPVGPIVEFSIITPTSGNIWDIKKLTDKEMILEGYSDSNKHLRLKFQK